MKTRAQTGLPAMITPPQLSDHHQPLRAKELLRLVSTNEKVKSSYLDFRTSQPISRTCCLEANFLAMINKSLQVALSLDVLPQLRVTLPSVNFWVDFGKSVRQTDFFEANPHLKVPLDRHGRRTIPQLAKRFSLDMDGDAGCIIVSSIAGSLRHENDGTWCWDAKKRQCRLSISCCHHHKEEITLSAQFIILLVTGQLTDTGIMLYLLGLLEISHTCHHGQQGCSQIGHIHLEPRDANMKRETCRILIVDLISQIMHARAGRQMTKTYDAQLLRACSCGGVDRHVIARPCQAHATLNALVKLGRGSREDGGVRAGFGSLSLKNAERVLMQM